MTPDQALILEKVLCEDFYWSPYKFALWAYPWGEGELRAHNGPKKWQVGVMKEIEAYLRDSYKNRSADGDFGDFFRKAVASGRGPGKSALIGMLSHWFLSTRVGGSVWVAANGKPQLESKTFPEIAKWVMLGINRDFWEVNATIIRPAKWFGEYIGSSDGLNKSTKYYYIAGVLWSEENPDAFAGAHNWDGEMSLFDEASGIPNDIWKVQEGVFTENIPDRFWFAFSNPRRPSGQFFDCFHKDRDMWRPLSVNSMEVEGINKATFNNIIAKHGEDSDTARIEVFGRFPSVGDTQFMSRDAVENAAARELQEDADAPLLMGVDVARFGDDESVIRFRKGRDARSYKPIRFKHMDTMQLATQVALLIDRESPDKVFIDGGGVGGGVVDRLKQLGYKVIEVQSGERANSPDKHLNKRVEMWDGLRDWLRTGCIEDDPDLIGDLLAPEYEITAKGQIKLESKADMKKRGIGSPDDADALALTFAFPVGYKRGSRTDAKDAVSYRGKRYGALQGNGSWMN